MRPVGWVIVSIVNAKLAIAGNGSAGLINESPIEMTGKSNMLNGSGGEFVCCIDQKVPEAVWNESACDVSNPPA